MKAHIKIPRGWRRLRELEPIKARDRIFQHQSMKWRPVHLLLAGVLINQDERAPLIRKIKARKGGKAK